MRPSLRKRTCRPSSWSAGIRGVANRHGQLDRLGRELQPQGFGEDPQGFRRLTGNRWSEKHRDPPGDRHESADLSFPPAIPSQGRSQFCSRNSGLSRLTASPNTSRQRINASCRTSVRSNASTSAMGKPRARSISRWFAYGSMCCIAPELILAQPFPALSLTSSTALRTLASACFALPARRSPWLPVTLPMDS